MNQNNEQSQASVQNVSSTKETLKRLILRSYFLALFSTCIVAFIFSHRLSALLVLLLAFSLVLYLCCNCTNCNYQTPFVAGQVIMAPPNRVNHYTCDYQDTIAYTIVLPERNQISHEHQTNSSGPPPMYQPPPSYEESQRQYK